jgi:hypothetical protein
MWNPFRLHPRIIATDTAPRRDTHLANPPVRPGIDAQTPSSMPRGEDDEDTRANSPEFHDRPGSGKDTANRLTFF